MTIFNKTVLFVFLLFSCGAAMGAEVGVKKADQYFIKRSNSPEVRARKNQSHKSRAHYLALHFGTFVNDDSYNWGQDGDQNVGEFNFGLTYRVGEWTDSSDLNLRIDFSSYALKEGDSTKMSIMPLYTFPDAESSFPLYFGGGLGGGVFFKQIDGESSLSVDYTLLVGARFFDVLDDVGLFLETGLKNHLLLLSDGQFNGVYINAGSVFLF